MSLADYLAQKYLTKEEPAKKIKKRKRKEKESHSVIIADDDVLGWDNNGGERDEDDDGPITVGETTRDFRRTTKSNWKTLSDAAETAAADAIIAASTPQSDYSHTDAPTVVDSTDASIQKLSSGAHAGLQTASQLTAQLKKQRQSEAARWANSTPEESGRGQETIYRDASGRIINLAKQRTEIAQKQAEESAAKARSELAQKGTIQLLAAQEQKQKLKDAKYLPIARYADDKELNEDLKDIERWNDPAAAFLTDRKSAVSKTGKPLYKGAAAPNRYGILPGHRWDGVDRGNGFEKKWFQARNAKANRANAEYEWQMDE